MHPVAGSELFDVIASEKRHHLLMLPLKWRRRLCGVGRGGTGGGEAGTLVGDAAHELSEKKGGEKTKKALAATPGLLGFSSKTVRQHFSSLVTCHATWNYFTYPFGKEPVESACEGEAKLGR